MTIKDKAKVVLGPTRLLLSYRNDFMRFLHYSFYFQRRHMSTENLRGEITFEYHAIEKGLSHDTLRLGFGKKRTNRLMSLLNQWVAHDCDKYDKRFLTGIAVLNRYVQVHEQNNFYVSEMKNKLAPFQVYLGENQVSGGELLLSGQILSELSNSSFEDFSASRRSVRKYGTVKITKNQIEKVISLANNAPSVCNRQSVKLHVVMNDKLVQETLKLQNGIQGMAENVSGVILVTSDLSYFGHLNERNESFIDGGIYLMNLLYSLTHYQIASCALNSNLNLTKMKEVRNLLHIPENENLIAFVSFGSYPDTFKTPVSNRDVVEDMTSFL
ncbi:nitroreductase family protein [Enterococcus timonensis]|uniref:nitroreductase family protein n=1 Tax=Enterococcus timonensis TaxID=1852364 RepID=UPI0008D9808E|nr:nitroreductase family protein [Enterococcus timonensis]